MSKPIVHFAITANRLHDGAVVYRTAEARWSPELSHAELTPRPEDRDQQLAWAKGQEHEVCGMYVLEVLVEADGTRRLSQRERLRADGALRVLERLRLRESELKARTAKAGGA